MCQASTVKKGKLDETTALLKKEPISDLSASVGWKVLLAGQLLSFFISGSGAVSSTLAKDCKINSPTAQTISFYIFLSFYLVSVRRGQQRIDATAATINDAGTQGDQAPSDSEDAEALTHRLPLTKLRLKAPWYIYFVIAFLDVEANYLTYVAFQYTNFTSVTLIRAMSIPSCMVLSRVILKTEYGRRHMLGILICLAGLVLSLYADARGDDNGGGGADPRKNQLILGDVIALVGAILSGMGDTLNETCVKKFSVTEYLGMLGTFGALVSAVQIAVLEPNFFTELLAGSSDSCGPAESVTLFLLNGTFLFLYYAGESNFLRHNDAALLNLSVLSANLYAVLFTIKVQHTMPSFPFLGAMGLVIAGVMVYESGSTTFSKPGKIELASSISSEKAVMIDV